MLDPRFGALPLVLWLMSGSPALDQGHSSGTAADQRGQTRPTDLPFVGNASGGDGSDIGAYEMEGLPNLSIRHSVPSGGFNTVILSWPNPSTGYVLQQSANMQARAAAGRT